MGFDKLYQTLKMSTKQTVAVAWAADAPVLSACVQAYQQGLVENFILTGVAEDIQTAASESQLDISPFSIVPASNPKEAAQAAVQQIRTGRAGILMKGLLNTSVLLKAVLDREQGLRSQTLLSHIAIIEFTDQKFLLLTDGGMNIRPDLEQKVQIVNNAIKFAYDLGIVEPKVALLAAIENVNPKMPETLDAASLVQMGARNQFAKKAIIDGPLAFDNAVSSEAAKHKGIESPVAGQADILVVPEIVSGNVLYKSFTYAAHLETAGIIYGASCPIVLTSRADSPKAKLNSIAIACRAALKE